MKNIKPTLVLLVICVIVSGMLAVVNHFTASAAVTDPAAIIAQMSADYAEIFPGEEYELLYRASDYTTDATGIPVEAAKCASGYLITVHSSGQYSSTPISVLVGIGNDGNVAGIKILKINETPGMGSKVNDRSFLDRFIGGSSFSLDGKQGSKIDGVTGATRSSKALVRAVNIAMGEYGSIVGGEGK